jgi:hypothetical protein
VALPQTLLEQGSFVETAMHALTQVNFSFLLDYTIEYLLRLDLAETVLDLVLGFESVLDAGLPIVDLREFAHRPRPLKGL